MCLGLGVGNTTEAGFCCGSLVFWDPNSMSFFYFFLFFLFFHVHLCMAESMWCTNEVTLSSGRTSPFTRVHLANIRCPEHFT